VPGGQAIQDAEFRCSDFEPGGHGEQTDEPAEAAEVPSKQGVHVSALVLLLKEPGAQSMQRTLAD